MRRNMVILVFLCIIFVRNAYADVPFVVEIRNITVNGGMVYVGIYTDEESVKKVNPGRIVPVKPSSEVLSVEIQLPEGEYVIGILQDTNGNEAMDFGLWGIPKEPYGWSNMKGKIPGNFNQLKFRVNTQNNKIWVFT
jgi:uncharacterized protein (DUF2141 family)